MFLAILLATIIFSFSTIFDGKYHEGNIREDLPSTFGVIAAIMTIVYFLS